MPRVKGGNRRLLRRKKLTKSTKGYWGRRKNVFRHASETHYRAMAFATRDRRQKKREFRKLWNIRISAALEAHDFSYSRLIHGLKLANVELNRKMLSDIAIHSPEGFAKIVEIAKGAAKAA